MSLMRSYAVFCDAETHAEACPFGTGYWPSSQESRVAARRQGWVRDATPASALERTDLSPECAARAAR